MGGGEQPAAQTVDGLQLHLCATNATGYKGVTQSTGALKKQMEYLLARCSPLHSGMQLQACNFVGHRCRALAQRIEALEDASIRSANDA